MLSEWITAEIEKDHEQGVVHLPTSTGGYCPTCLLKLEASLTQEKEK